MWLVLLGRTINDNNSSRLFYVQFRKARDARRFAQAVRASVGVGADAACVATLEGGSVSRAAGLLARRLWLSYRPMVVPMSLPTLSWKKKAVAFLTVDMAY